VGKKRERVLKRSKGRLLKSCIGEHSIFLPEEESHGTGGKNAEDVKPSELPPTASRASIKS